MTKTERLLLWLGGLVTLAKPVVKLVNFVIGLGGIPSDLATWRALLSKVVGGYSVLDWSLLGVGTICLLLVLMPPLQRLLPWRPRPVHVFDTEITERAALGDHVEAETRHPAYETSLTRGMRLAREARELGLELRPPAPSKEDAFKARVALEESQTPAMPDMSFEDVVARVTERLGADPNRIHEAIVDAAYHKRVDVWGRMVAGKPAKRVWTEAWENGTFSLSEGTVVYRSPDNPHAQYRWTGLMFNRAQVNRWMPPDLGPNGWMAA